MTSTTNIPKYLEILHDEQDTQPTVCRPYEIPLAGPGLEADTMTVNAIHNHDQSPTICTSSIDLDVNDDNGAHNRKEPNISNSNNKERTFSSSSTVSETSLCFAYATPTSKTLGQNVILTVALPNAKEDCTSNENLLTSDIRNSTNLKQDKIRQFYTIAPAIDDVTHCEDGITLM